MRKTYICILCDKKCFSWQKIGDRTISRNAYCLDCVPLDLSFKEIGKIIGDTTKNCNDIKSKNTFKCFGCGDITRKSIGHRDNRMQRRKYCIKCLPKNEHPKTLESLNGKEMICNDCSKKYIFKSKSKITTKICYACYWKARRRQLKRKTIECKGGKCQICGYNYYDGALTLHHLDPSKKEYNISKAFSWEKIKRELPKCILVCFNCHQEIHGGVRKIPKKVKATIT